MYQRQFSIAPSAAIPSSDLLVFTYSDLEDKLLAVVGGLKGVENGRELLTLELDCARTLVGSVGGIALRRWRRRGGGGGGTLAPPCWSMRTYRASRRRRAVGRVLREQLAAVRQRGPLTSVGVAQLDLGRGRPPSERGSSGPPALSAITSASIVHGNG